MLTLERLSVMLVGTRPETGPVAFLLDRLAKQTPIDLAKRASSDTIPLRLFPPPHRRRMFGHLASTPK